MKKKIYDFSLENKKVIIRVDFNVPIDNGKVVNDERIRASLKTIKYAMDKSAKVILLSHLGRIKSEADKKKNTLEPVADCLSHLLGVAVQFSKVTRGKELEEKVKNLKNSEVLLVENTRYEDLNGNLESGNDESLGKYWASLGDIFINDAFATCHRSHASNVGISNYIPSGIGFLIESELDYLEKIMNNPKRPFTVILGGAKVSDKIGVVRSLVKKADYVLIGGGMAYTFLSAKGYNIGKSILDEDSINFCKDLIKDYPEKIILPVDSINTLDINNPSLIMETGVDNITDDQIGVDIGTNTVDIFNKYIKESKTIFWNGPVGMFEKMEYSKGTIGLLECLKDVDAVKVIGGGDTATACIKFGYRNDVTYISTGGGASLLLLEGKKLAGIENIDEK